MMRKIIAIILCLCVLATLLSGCGGSSIQEYEEDTEQAGETEPVGETEPAEGEEAEAEPTPSPKPGLGYAAYDPDEVVATYNGTKITWREYYYWLNYYAGYVQYLASMGSPFSGWDGNDYSADLDNATLVRDSAADSMFQYHAIEALAEQEDLTPDEEAVQTAYDQAADSYGDGDGECTEEEAGNYAEFLDGQFVDRPLFDYLTGVGQLSGEVFTALYGENGENVPDKDALAYAEELGLLACKHILFMTVDTQTGESLSDEEIEEKKTKADELYEQLSAVQDDPDELVELFDKLMNENSEDTGLAYYPDGYLFASGVMVPVFEETTAALEEYGLSEPVQSDYGYHIILRLPVDPNGSFTDSSGSSAPLKAAAGNAALAKKLTETVDEADVIWKGDFENVDIAEIFGE